MKTNTFGVHFYNENGSINQLNLTDSQIEKLRTFLSELSKECKIQKMPPEFNFTLEINIPKRKTKNTENNTNLIQTILQERKIDKYFIDVLYEAWEIWKLYRKRNHKFIYVNIKSEQRAINKLLNLTHNNIPLAVECINQSVDAGWKDFYEIKNNSNQLQPTQGSYITPSQNITPKRKKL